MTMLSELECDAITEIMNIGVGRAAASLSLIVKEEILLSVPKIEVLYGATDHERIIQSCHQMVAVREQFSGIVHGSAALLFAENKSLDLVCMMLDQDPDSAEVIELEQEALVEIGNIILNGCLSSLADALKGEIQTTVPALLKQSIDLLKKYQTINEAVLLFLTIDFSIKSRDISGNILFFLDMNTAGEFRNLIRNYVETLC